MKDDPNNEVVADSVIAGNFPNRIKARRGYDVARFERQCHHVRLQRQFDKSLPKFQAGNTQANSDQDQF
jgi:hypothetical protein